jgi:hypothetical protein
VIFADATGQGHQEPELAPIDSPTKANQGLSRPSTRRRAGCQNWIGAAGQSADRCESRLIPATVPAPDLDHLSVNFAALVDPGRQRADRPLPDSTGISLTRNPGSGISKSSASPGLKVNPDLVADRHRSCDLGEHQVTTLAAIAVMGFSTWSRHVRNSVFRDYLGARLGVTTLPRLAISCAIDVSRLTAPAADLASDTSIIAGTTRHTELHRRRADGPC